MAFNYESYCNMIYLLQEKGYSFSDYENWENYDKCVILRHDVDTSLEKAVELAEIEAKINVHSYYFILLTTDFYNAASMKGQQAVHRILELGHKVGLHFDETLYNSENMDALTAAVKHESGILSGICNTEISAVSMHRPSKNMIAKNFEVPGLINVYGNTFFNEFKYVSDSRRNWREPVLDIIDSEKYNRLHILTHPFWYGKEDRDITQTVRTFVNNANRERYFTFKNNITCIEDIMKESEIQ